MTRKEEIIQTARQKEIEVGFSQFVYETKGVNSAYGIGFLEGAEWADNHTNLTWKDIMKEVDLNKEIYDAEKRFGDIDEMGGYRILMFDDEFRDVLRHFFELGLKAQKGE